MMERFFIILGALTLLLVVAIVGSESTQGDAVDALEDLGFTDVELTGYRAFGCGRGDTFANGFRAKNPRGRVVEGVVCSGVLKGSTVRFDRSSR